jgi:predicted O-methyltransferase YrrM
MFHSVPPSITARMEELERIDARDRIDGTPHRERLRQIPSETGRFLAILAATAPAIERIGFCFLDAEKDVYLDCYEAVIPNLVPGGLLVADNATSHREALHPVIDRASADPRGDAVVVPIGRGELVCRRTATA